MGWLTPSTVMFSLQSIDHVRGTLCNGCCGMRAMKMDYAM